MALGAVLVDRARLLEMQAASPVKVEGTTQFATVRGNWFKARLFLPAGAQDSTPGDAPLMRGIGKGRIRALDNAQLLIGIRDLEGDLLDIHFDMKVEVESLQLGNGIYRIMNEPERIRKKRKVIGFLADIERSNEREFEPI